MRFNPIFHLLQFVLITLFSSHLQAGNTIRVTNLRTEYKTNPTGIGVASPRFSWEIQSSGKDIRQTAWQIRAAATEKELKAGKNLLWDTGKVYSDKSIQIPYQGLMKR